jgi:hypothetical protein
MVQDVRFAIRSAMRNPALTIRMALGAARADVLRMVLRLDADAPGCGRWTGRGVRRDAADRQPVVRQSYRRLTFGAISALLAAVAMVASLLPARRAARVDPLIALPRMLRGGGALQISA